MTLESETDQAEIYIFALRCWETARKIIFWKQRNERTMLCVKENSK